MRFAIALALLAVSSSAAALNDSTLLWFRDGNPTTQAIALQRELAGAASRGLNPLDYRLPPTPTDTDLTSMAERFASDLSRGRVSPEQLGYDLDVPRAPLDEKAVVGTLASSTDLPQALDALEPQLIHYRLLRAALARYRALAAAGVRLPAPSQTKVSPGEPYTGAPELRELLQALGDMPATTAAVATAPVLDTPLQDALRRFQARHGLEADGVLGRATYRALSVPLEQRVTQIELAMERIRWLPLPLDSPPIIVNVPQFRLFAFRTTSDRAQDILQMDVIVGADFKGRRTPVFAADMRYVVLQPYWDVPRSILVKEMLPQIASDTSWIERNGYEIVRGQTDASPVVAPTPENIALLARGALRLRQKPGPTNALGRIKFMLPNTHQVYLHDTPARAMFSRSRRALSHGCIRVADPMALLAHVMRNDPSWTDEKREAALANTSSVRVPLIAPVRVFILYGTALATEAGTVMFFDDIYEQDAPLLEKLRRSSRTSSLRSVEDTRIR